MLPSLTRLETLSPLIDTIVSYDSISSRIASEIFPFILISICSQSLP